MSEAAPRGTARVMPTFVAIVIAVVSACCIPSPSRADFNNGDFETPPGLAPWQVTHFLNDGLSAFPPQTQADLGLLSGGFDYSSRLTDVSPRSQTPTGMSPGANVPLWPYFDTGSAVINEYGPNDPHGQTYPRGANRNVNSLKQLFTTSAADLNPFDGRVHVGFVLAPVLQAGGHAVVDETYFFIVVRNRTAPRAGDLYTYFVYANQPGVPWQTQPYDVFPNISMEDWLYTGWQIFDIALRDDQFFVGDQLELELFAAGCQAQGHVASLYLDGVSTRYSGVTVNLSAPTAANVDSNLEYVFTVENGGEAAETNVVVDEMLPTNTTFVSLDAPGASCTSPLVGQPGAVECTYATLNAGTSVSFTLVVHNNAPAPGGAGTASGGSANELFKVGPAWTTNQWGGYTVYLTGATGAGQERVVASNTASALSVAVPWTVVPDSSTTFAILNPPAFTATASSGSAATLTRSGAGFIPNEFSEATLTLLSGAGAGQVRTITSNDSDTLYVTPSFTTNPTSSTVFAVTRSLKVLNGNYGVRSQDQPRLLGPLVETSLTPATPYADLQVSNSDGTSTVNWGGSTQYTMTVTNKGPASVVDALVTNTFSAELGAAAWTCTPPASCGAPSGNGDINAIVSLAAGQTATFTIDATVAAGSGVGTATSLAVVTGGGVVENRPLDNADTDRNDIIEPTPTPTSTATATHTPTATATLSPTSTQTGTPIAAVTPTATATPSPTPIPPGQCPPAPSTGCRTATKSTFRLRGDELTWRWNSGTTSLFDFGYPVIDPIEYTLCVYGTQNGTPALAMRATVAGGTTCGATFCWRAPGPRGFRYADSSGASDGITHIRLRAGTGNGSVLLKGSGANLPVPTPADPSNLLSQNPDVTVQLRNTKDICWEAVYPNPARRSRATIFVDRF